VTDDDGDDDDDDDDDGNTQIFKKCVLRKTKYRKSWY
jgi:hypothetical protein